MLKDPVVEEMSEDAVLDTAAELATTAQRAEVGLLRVAYRWAVLHDPARPLDPEVAVLPGREKARQYGGEGTAAVSEFAAAELGVRIGRTTHAAAALIADAQDLHHRHPVLWARVVAGEVRSSYARFVVTKTRELTALEAAWVDAEVAESADGRIPWTRFEALVAGKVAAAAPELAREKEERARRAAPFFASLSLCSRPPPPPPPPFLPFLPLLSVRCLSSPPPPPPPPPRSRRSSAHPSTGWPRSSSAPPSQSSPSSTRPSGRWRSGCVSSCPTTRTPPTPSASRSREERAPSEATTVVCADERRVLAVLMLANPDTAPEALDLTALVPKVEVVVHLDGHDINTDSDTGGVPAIGRVEGHGPVTREWVREVLGPHARFTIRPVFDPLGQVPVDAYEIPARHRRAVRVISPADVFPYSSCTSNHMQTDHTDPWAPGEAGGSSEVGLRTDDHQPPPRQDVRTPAGQATLPRCLPVARPLRCHLPRRPHRHPPHRPSRLSPVAYATGSASRAYSPHCSTPSGS